MSSDKKKRGGMKLFLLAIGLVIVAPVLITNLVDGAGQASTVPSASASADSAEFAAAVEKQVRDSADIRAEAKMRAQRAFEIEFKLNAEKAVRQLFKDPDSVKFQDVRFLVSDEFGDSISGRVNGKNSLDAYTGFRGFVSNGKTTLIEGRDERYAEALRELAAADGTRRTLENVTASKPEDLPVVFDITSLKGKSIFELASMLGEAVVEETNVGQKRTYRDGQIEGIFKSQRIISATVNGLDAVPFSQGAIRALGLNDAKPAFASDFILRWENVSGVAEISIFRGQKNCDYALIKFQ